ARLRAARRDRRRRGRQLVLQAHRAGGDGRGPTHRLRRPPAVAATRRLRSLPGRSTWGREDARSAFLRAPRVERSGFDYFFRVARIFAMWWKLWRSAWSSTKNWQVSGAPALSDTGAAWSSSWSVNERTAAAASAALRRRNANACSL